MQLDKSQLEAVDFATTRTLSVINGGAGVGKTTIIKAITERVRRPALCAYTGKAAARMTEATGFEASTIHRMLGSNGVSFTCKTLAGYNVIIDESSMNPTDLLAEIINRDPASITLVGDQAQLPPVGKGQPFHDIIRLRPDVVKTLTKCYRNSAAVYHSALIIRDGGIPEKKLISGGECWTMQTTGSAEATQEYIKKMVLAGSIDFNHDVILCPRNGDGVENASTVNGLNFALKNIVNRSAEPFAIGDRVINIKNCSEANVWNGTTGSIHAIDNSGDFWVKIDVPILDEKLSEPGKKVYTDKVKFNKEMRKSLQLAYALTVHKAQGSQYRRVVFVCLDRDTMMLDRSLIYTAVTRAKEACCIVGQMGAFRRGVETQKTKETVLQELAAG